MRHMKETRLMEVIEQFSVSELKQLKRFVDSPFFNTNKNVCALLDFIRKYEKDFNHEKFTQKQAAIYIFPKKKLNLSTVINLQSRLFDLVKQFICYHFKDDQTPDTELALMRFYRKKNLIRHFNSTYTKAQNIQEKYSYKDAVYHNNQFEIESLHTSFQVTNTPDFRPNYQKLIHTLDISFLTQKLMLFCQILNYQRITSVSFDMTLMNEILDFLPQSLYYEIPVIKLWYTALLLLKLPDQTEYYHQLKNLLYEHDNLIHRDDKRMLYTYLENTTRVIFKVKDRQYYEAMFELYTAQLQNEVMYINGYLLPMSLKNIVNVTLQLEQVDWTEKFLMQNKDKILPEHEDVFNYSLARLYLEQKKFDRVLEILNKIVPSDLFTNIDVRKARLMVYYEMKYTDIFESEVNRFRVFFANNQAIIPKNHLTAYRSFTNIIFNIYNTVKRDDERLNQIESQINNAPIIPERKWLLKKLQEKR